MRVLAMLILAISTLGWARPVAAVGHPRVVISVDLSRNVVTIFKYESGKRKPVSFTTPSLAVVKGSVKTGTYRGRLPTLTVRRERSATRLDHAILFDGQRAIRSSRHFQEMASHPIAGSVIVPGEYGGMIATVVKSAGGVATVVVHE